MKSNILPESIQFNLMFLMAGLWLYSAYFLTPKQKLMIALIGIFLFWCVNYHFLNQAEKYAVSSDLKTIADYQRALKLWLKKSNPFGSEIRKAISQLLFFSEKQAVLLRLCQNRDLFSDVNADVQNYLFANMKKILNRMMLLDLSQKHNFQMHKAYLHQILRQNQELLNQYADLLIEVSQLGAENQPAPCLDTVIEALQDFRCAEEYSTTIFTPATLI